MPKDYRNKITLHLDLDSDLLKKELQDASKSFNGFGADFEKNVTDALESITKNIQKQSEVWSKLLDKGLSVSIGANIEKSISQSISNGVETGIENSKRKLNFNPTINGSGGKYRVKKETLTQMSAPKRLAHYAEGFDSATKEAIDDLVAAKRELAKLLAQFQKEQLDLAKKMKAGSLQTVETDYTKSSNKQILNAIADAQDEVDKRKILLERRKKYSSKRSTDKQRYFDDSENYQKLAEYADKGTIKAKAAEKSFREQNEQINKVVEAVEKLNAARKALDDFNKSDAAKKMSAFSYGTEWTKYVNEIDIANKAVNALQNDPKTIEAGIKIIVENGKLLAKTDELDKVRQLILDYNKALAELKDLMFNPQIGANDQENAQIENHKSIVEQQVENLRERLEQIKLDESTSDEAIKLIRRNEYIQKKQWEEQEKASKEETSAFLRSYKQTRKDLDTQIKAEEKLEEQKKKRRIKFAKSVGKKVGNFAKKQAVKGLKYAGNFLKEGLVNAVADPIDGVVRIGEDVARSTGLTKDSKKDLKKADEIVNDVKKLAIDEENASKKLREAMLKGDSAQIQKQTVTIEGILQQQKSRIDEIKKLEKENKWFGNLKRSPEAEKFLKDSRKGAEERIDEELANKYLKERLKLQKQIQNIQSKSELSPKELDSIELMSEKVKEIETNYNNFFKDAEGSTKYADLLAEYDARAARHQTRNENLAKQQAENKAYADTTKNVIALQTAVNNLKLSMSGLDETEDAELLTTLRSLLQEKSDQLSSLESALKADDKETRDKLEQLRKKNEEDISVKEAKAKNAGSKSVSSQYAKLMQQLGKDQDSIFNTGALDKANLIMQNFADETISAKDAVAQLQAVSSDFAKSNVEFEEKKDKVEDLQDSYDLLAKKRKELQKLELVDEKTPLDNLKIDQLKKEISELTHDIFSGLKSLDEYDNAVGTKFGQEVRSYIVEQRNALSEYLKAAEDTSAQSALSKTVDELNKVYENLQKVASKNSKSLFAENTISNATQVMDDFTQGTIDAQKALSRLKDISYEFNASLEQETNKANILDTYENILTIRNKIDKLENGKNVGSEDLAVAQGLRKELDGLYPVLKKDLDALREFDNAFETDLYDRAIAEIKDKYKQFDLQLSGRDQDRKEAAEAEAQKEIDKKNQEALTQAQKEYNTQLRETVRLKKEAGKATDPNGNATQTEAEIATKNARNSVDALQERTEALKAAFAAAGKAAEFDQYIIEQAKIIRNTNEQIAQQRQISEAEAKRKAERQEQKELQNQYIALLREEYSIRTKMEKYSTKKGANPKDPYFTQLQKRLKEIGDNTSGEMGDVFSKIIDDEEFNKRIDNVKSNLDNNLAQAKASVEATLNNLKTIIGEGISQADDAQQIVFSHLESQYESFKVTTPWDGTKLTAEVLTTDGAVKSLTYTWNQFDQKIRESDNNTRNLSGSFSKLGAGITNLLNQMGRMVAGYMSINAIFNGIKQGIGYVKELDTAMTELKLVTQASDSEMTGFASSAASVADALASTTAEVIRSQTEWARLGYNASDSLELAKASASLAKAGFMETADATSQLTSAIQAFYADDISKGVITAGNAAEEISDKMVYVGNNFAITSQGIGESLQLASSAMLAAGNTLDDTIALTTAANTVAQDPRQVANALKVVSMRLRGTDAKAISQEVGEEVDVVDTGFAKLYGTIKKLTSVKSNDFQGISILTDAGQFKSTREILESIADVWEEIDDASQAALLEQLAG